MKSKPFNSKEVMSTAMFYGLIGGLVFIEISRFCSGIQYGLKNWYFTLWAMAITGPMFGALFFGIQWSLACSIPALALVLLLRKVPSCNQLFVYLVSAVAGVAGTTLFHKFFLREMVLGNRNCDAVCLGLEDLDFGIPFWQWILIGLWLTSILQAYGVMRDLRSDEF
ncbi:MAG: hypothetical protein KDD62_14410 [Bdellovibrionales bacterium]|nr:hypothetical protein [Bdellovibrionales bacterium]